MIGPLEQEAKNGHKLLALGHDTYAETSMFKGKAYGSIRRWFRADDGVWYRTKNGLQMMLSELQAILENAPALEEFLRTETPVDEEAGDAHERGW